MSKILFIRYISFLLIGYIFTPVIFENIPLPGIGIGSLLLFFTSLLLFYPKIYFYREMIYLYFLILTYYLLVNGSYPIQELAWFNRRIIPLFLGVSLFIYYFKISNDIAGIRQLFYFSLICMVISSCTTIMGLSLYPTASRDMASSVGGNIHMLKFYKQIGIGGYGFITSLIYIIPFFVFATKDMRWNKWRIVLLIILLIVVYTSVKAQYSAQFLFLFLALILSIMGAKKVKKNILIVAILFLGMIFTPKVYFANSISSLADFLPGEKITNRLLDFSQSIEEGNLGKTSSHTSYRYNRIPYLLEQFLASPVLGSGKSTGHVFWLDHLALYGILGTSPIILILVSIYRRFGLLLKSSYFYYLIAFTLFILLGFIKGSGNREQYIMLFFILPAGLFLYENNLLFNKIKVKK